jgi:hypothetical protein
VGIIDTNFVLDAAASRTTYYWRVRGENAAGTGLWSASRTFAAVAPSAAPGAATPSAPVTNARSVTTNPVLSWPITEGASTYTIQLSRSIDFPSYTLDSSGLRATTCALDGLVNDVDYFWRIRAVNAIGSGPWSSVSTFRTFARPITSPDNAVANSNFAEGTTGWQVTTDGKEDFSVSSPGHKDPFYAKIHILQSGNYVEVSARDLMMQPDTVYRLAFSAYSSSGNDMAVSLIRDEPPYTTYGLASQHVLLSTDWKEYALEFTSKNFSSFVNNGRLVFRLDGPARQGDVLGIDDVQLAKSNGEPSTAQNGPRDFDLAQNYPNPFNPSTTIRYGLPGPSMVTLTVYNALGQQVAVLQDGMQEPGYHEMKFDGTGLASGFYLYRLTAGDFVQTRKMLLVR